MVIIIVSCWHKNRNKDQWNRLKSPEISPPIYGQLIYNKRAKNIQRGKDSFFSTWFWQNWIFTFTVLFIHSSSRQTKVLNIWSETIKILDENVGTQLLDISLSDGVFFFGFDTKIKGHKSKNKQVELHKTKKLLQNKRYHQYNEKATYWMGENICKNNCECG